MPANTITRRRAVSDLKRTLILDAARAVFEAEGLDGASLRAIAAKSGYTPAALYFHFDSKEAIYAEVLAQSLERLNAHVAKLIKRARTPPQRFQCAALAWFGFYAQNPNDLDLGFYLFRGGLKPRGLGRDRNSALNAALEASLAPLAEAALEMGANEAEARDLMAGVFAHATGLLTLTHTGRTRLLKVNPIALMAHYVTTTLTTLRSKSK